ncbi:hypothetical protein H5V45_16130 [Nocardioides sp. KIGAM211]|uniref:Uncharacterized protein n=1 Tax=Nocardioides luti TaxID=2761101 RepID=A0A7X0VCC3_9ACTN|nr:hypothetical protein [Nocardioides luti]MBB6628857.1 hypothetical protein [Nocardioides luti]
MIGTVADSGRATIVSGSPVRSVLVTGVVVAALMWAGVLVYAASGSDESPSGPHAEFTRSQLVRLTARGSARNPVLLPRDLPPGTDNTGERDFTLLNKPFTSTGRQRAGAVWLTEYSVGALPPADGRVTGYTVYQEWSQTPELHRPRCRSGRRDNVTVVRVVGDDQLTICLGPDPTAASREYWSTVAFTSSLSDVGWLRGTLP